jgi:hypothetical protein
MRIKQCRVSKQVESFRYYFRKRYDLGKYLDINSPVLFFGLYEHIDVKKLLLHNPQSLVVVLWGGSDILKQERIDAIRHLKNVKHIALSSFIQEDLRRNDLSCKLVPISTSKLKDLKCCPLGNEIHTYVPSVGDEFYKFYGGLIIEEVQKKCKYKINISMGFNHYSREDLIKIYRRCFLGLRLTPHDGIANTVVELGVMGRKCIYNGGTPGSIKWSPDRIDEIVKNIECEAKNIGSINEKLSNKWWMFLNTGNDWLNTKFWKD